MSSGSHVTQLDSHPSAIGAFLEGVLKCNPQPSVRSCVLKVQSIQSRITMHKLVKFFSHSLSLSPSLHPSLPSSLPHSLTTFSFPPYIPPSVSSNDTQLLAWLCITP